MATGSPLDLTGQRFTRLLVLCKASSVKSGSAWRCRCDCGNEVVVSASNLKTRNNKSCGCLKIDRVRERSLKHGFTTGYKVPREYRAWQQMIARCHVPTHEAFKNYGARGIRVCRRWRDDFGAFMKDMGPRPLRATVERVDNSKGYRPSNCRWASRREQANNTRTNRRLQFNGVTRTVAEWARHLGVKPATLYMRLHRGWTVAEVLNGR